MEADLNVDEKQLPYGPYVPGAMLQNMEHAIIKINPEWQYQLQQSLNADIYSGYMMTPTPFAGNKNNSNYFMMDGWNGFITSIAFNEIMNPWLEIKKVTEQKEPDLYAVSLIIKVLAMHRLTDVFGPLPYTRYGQGNSVAWDCQEGIYNAFFDELNAAIGILTKIENDTPDFDGRWAKYDRSSFGGDYKKWIQLANSLKLRLAIRTAQVTGRAKTEAETAVHHKYGTLDKSSGSFLIIHSFKHPVATISTGWNDILMGAPMESILGGYNDPRLLKYFTPAADPAVAGQYKGIRQGIDIPAKSVYSGFSMINLKATDPVAVMVLAETCFLKAEGVINSWNMGGTAQYFYDEGIKASFDQHGLSGVTTYLNDASSKPKPYKDPKNPANDINSGDANLSTVTVKWEEGDTESRKRERIITQKWIAMFPDGQEAWSEFRRTGYPKLFPVVINNSPDIPKGEFIRRLPFPSSVSTTSPTQYTAAVANCLGGKDNPFTALWWDK